MTRALAVAERPHLEAQPTRRPALGAGDAHFLLQALAFARGLEQPVDGLGSVRIADEHALDRPHVVGVRRIDEFEIGGVGVNDAPLAVGDDDAVEGVVDDGFDQRACRFRRRKPQDAGGEREQREHADCGEHRQEGEDVRLGIAAAEHHDAGRGGDQHGGNQQHQDDAAAARRAGAAVDRLARRRSADRVFAGAMRCHVSLVPRLTMLPSGGGQTLVPRATASRKRLCGERHDDRAPATTRRSRMM